MSKLLFKGCGKMINTGVPPMTQNCCKPCSDLYEGAVPEYLLCNECQIKLKKQIDKSFQNEKGCGKSLLETDSYVLCGDATYDQSGGLNKVRAFCDSCRDKFALEKEGEQ